MIEFNENGAKIDASNHKDCPFKCKISEIVKYFVESGADIHTGALLTSTFRCSQVFNGNWHIHRYTVSECKDTLIKC